MKGLKIIYSAILHGFLGYVWIIFILHMLELFNKSGKSSFVGCFIAIGTLLFLDLTTRVFESFDRDKKHPARIAGYASFGLVIFSYLIYINQSSN
ncbi:hypothetical protein [Bacillus sp. FJAT-50079]|uniref:hypothetical protein n=1 Tax=Bacillus sp. FJAT-50079 TaxID=2833577 RepID=UPI001BC9E9C3|nr:hypothetical protein [Bacillus sp. FJAT-50079]MBS4210730.1 hypothetical protein [Bacillus sp. FJAT-50079]